MEKLTEEYGGIAPEVLLHFLGAGLVEHLAALRQQLGPALYLTGGTVRDILLGREPVDIDLTVPAGARRWATELSRRTGGANVPLGRDEDAARVVWKGRDIDFSSFREGAQTIEEELVKRDITVNSMALSLETLLDDKDTNGLSDRDLIDPLGGIGDLRERIIRVSSRDAFKSDPLRLLRVYRFAATLGFSVEEETAALAALRKEWITRPAAERVGHELELIMGSGRARTILEQMAANGLLFEVIPELLAGKGMEQPASHHLDVFEHSLAALGWMEAIQERPSTYFKTCPSVMEFFLGGGRRRLQLCWAALFHDLGKPVTVAIDEDRGGRITFYNHDQAGARLVETIGRRLRWSVEDIRTVAWFVGNHMHPFHLGNVSRQGNLTLKACLRLVKKAGSLLPGLFLLAMADALAGQGEGRPDEIEQEVDALFSRMEEVRSEHVEPVRAGPPLITGRDLIEELHLEPGPMFRRILESVEDARMEKRIGTREEALSMAREFTGGEAGSMPGSVDCEEESGDA